MIGAVVSFPFSSRARDQSVLCLESKRQEMQEAGKEQGLRPSLSQQHVLHAEGDPHA